MKPILYISGPYSAATLIQRQKNVHRATERYIEALKSDEWWVVCPHTMTNEMEIHVPEMTHEEWIVSDITILSKCDAIWADYLDNKKGSVGTRLELAWALLSGMPIHLGTYPPSIHQIHIDNRCKDLTDPVYYDLEEDMQKIFDMVADGMIPDPVFYAGDLTVDRKPPTTGHRFSGGRK